MGILITPQMRATDMPWQKGKSGNPAGRPVGIPQPGTRLRNAILSDIPDIIAAMVAQAKSGDVGAAKLLFDRCLPVLKPERIPWPVPAALEGQQGILAALAAGEVSVDDACRLLTALKDDSSKPTELVVRWEGTE